MPVVAVRIEEEDWRCACVENPKPRRQARVVQVQYVRTVGTLEVGFPPGRLGSRILGVLHLDLEKIETPIHVVSTRSRRPGTRNGCTCDGDFLEISRSCCNVRSTVLCF